MHKIKTYKKRVPVPGLRAIALSLYTSLLISFTIIASLSCGPGTERTKIEKEEYRRVVSLSPNMTEILDALMALDLVVWVTSDCEYSFEKRQIVGRYTNPDLEKIFTLDPDLILYTGTGKLQVNEKFQRLGIKIWHMDILSLDDLYRTIIETGRILKKKERADIILKEMKDELNLLKKKSRKREQSLYIEIWYPPVYSAGRASFLHEAAEYLNLKNITGEIENPYPEVDWEYIVRKDPDIMLFLYSEFNREALRGRPGYRQLSAPAKNAIINPDYYPLLLRPSPRLVKGLKKLQEDLEDRGL